MSDPRAATEPAQLAAATDSHGPAKKPRRKPALLDDANQGADPAQNSLDVRSALPLHLKPVLNGYVEVQLCGICSERALRRHIATGRVKRSVIRNGRNLRFVKDTLIDELRGSED